MTAKIFLFAVWSVIAALLAPPQSGLVSSLAAPDLPSGAGIIQPQWTVWGAEQYALADDGASIWIGGVGGVVQWDKATGTYRRFSRVDGLPQTQVLAIAVDTAGNRWFGGIGGLSRLDAAGDWTHLTAANSGLWSDEIAALDVTTDGALYVAHALPDGVVSRLSAAGEWHWFPNRYTAVQADYAAIASSPARPTDLWTVAGAEVWAGHWVYDGSVWRERPLPYHFEIAGSVVDREGDLWVRADGYPEVWEWLDGAWKPRMWNSWITFSPTVLAVDNEGRVWAGGSGSVHPYAPPSVIIRDLTQKDERHLGQLDYLSTLMSTAEGLWGTGPGWLMQPGFGVTVLPDIPRYQIVWDALVDGSGPLWVTSRPAAEQFDGGLQMLDDRGTTARADDAWRNEALACPRVTAMDRLDGDVWYAVHCYNRLGSPPEARRRHAGVDIGYKLPITSDSRVTDIFAQDEHRVWFAITEEWYSGKAYVVGLDDAGTPSKLDDDIWQTLDVGVADGPVSVAVDAQGQLWRGQGDGLYRYDGAAWQQVSGGFAVCDLTPARDGTLYAQLERERDAGCEVYSDNVLVVSPEGMPEQYARTVKTLVTDDPVSVRSATRRNRMWTVAADGAILFTGRAYPRDTLNRVLSSGELQTYTLPVAATSVRRLEVDGRGQVWLVGDGKLWRMEGPAIERLYLPLLSR